MISIYKLASLVRRHAEEWSTNGLCAAAAAISTGRQIFRTLIDGAEMGNVEDEDLIATYNVPAGREQVENFEQLLTRIPRGYFPESDFVRLLRQDGDRPKTKSGSEVWRRLLDEKRVAKVTTDMFAVAKRAGTVQILLDYDPSYIVTPETLGRVGTNEVCSEENRHQPVYTGDDENGRGRVHPRPNSSSDLLECMEVLMLNNKSLHPTESNILRVVQLGQYPGCQTKRLLDLMFARKPAPRVTEQMLLAARDPHSLRALLDHAGIGQQLVTPRVLSVMARHGAEMVVILLDYDPSAQISTTVMRDMVSRKEVKYVETLLERRPDLCLPEEITCATIRSRSQMYPESWHSEFIAVLRRFPNRCPVSLELKKEVDKYLTRGFGLKSKGCTTSLLAGADSVRPDHGCLPTGEE